MNVGYTWATATSHADNPLIAAGRQLESGRGMGTSSQDVRHG